MIARAMSSRFSARRQGVGRTDWVRPTPPPRLAFSQKIFGFDDRQGVLLDVDIWFVVVLVDRLVADARRHEPLHHQLFKILDRGWLRIVLGPRQHRDAATRRTLADKVDLGSGNDAEAGASWDELAD